MGLKVGKMAMMKESSLESEKVCLKETWKGNWTENWKEKM